MPPNADIHVDRSADGVVRRARPVMGTVASIHVHDPADVELVNLAIDELFAELRRLEEMFSTFRPTSEISRVNRGELELIACSAEVIDVLDACTWLEQMSNGAFDARPKGPDGPLDPAGFVKGWAAERASAALGRRGLSNWYVNVGGDLLVSGSPVTGGRWRIGLADPNVVGQVRATVEVESGAVATSGTAERGTHLWDRRTGKPAEAFASLTVMGPSLTWADAFATTVFVMGMDGLTWLEGFETYHGIGIRHDGSLVTTSALAGALDGQ